MTKYLHNSYNPGDVIVPSWKKLGRGPGDVNMLSLDKMAEGQVTQTCHHE